MGQRNEPPEPWAPIGPPFSRYEASYHGGHIRRIGRPLPLAQRVGNKSPYALVKPYDDNGKQQTVTAHSLVLIAHHGPRPDGDEGCHAGDDPAQNCAHDLRCDTPDANRIDRYGLALPPIPMFITLRSIFRRSRTVLASEGHARRHRESHQSSERESYEVGTASRSLPTRYSTCMYVSACLSWDNA